MKYLKYVANEAINGVKDNLNGLKNIFIHPLDTVTNLVNAVLHPINTLSNLASFAWQHPIRFTTNVGLSSLQGKIIAIGFKPYFPSTQAPSNITADLNNTFNATQTSTPLLYSFNPTSSTLTTPPMCSIDGCMLSASSATTSTPSLVQATTSGTQVVTNKKLRNSKL